MISQIVFRQYNQQNRDLKKKKKIIRLFTSYAKITLVALKILVSLSYNEYSCSRFPLGPDFYFRWKKILYNWNFAYKWRIYRIRGSKFMYEFLEHI